MTLITAALLRQIGAASRHDEWAALSGGALRHGITTPLRVAAFLANVLHETGGLATLIENLNYTPAGLRATWRNRFSTADAERMGRTAKHPADQRAIAERAYGGRLGNRPEGSGDGWHYRGRGCIQLTGRANYQAFADRIGVTLAELPAILETRDGAAESAACWWERAGCNQAADTGSIVAVRQIVNGGLNGIDDVVVRYRAALAALGSRPTPAPISDADRLNEAQLARARI